MQDLALKGLNILANATDCFEVLSACRFVCIFEKVKQGLASLGDSSFCHRGLGNNGAARWSLVRECRDIFVRRLSMEKEVHQKL